MVDADQFKYGDSNWGCDEHILALLAETDGDTWAAAETLCDKEVYMREYEGCSTDLELAFSQYEARAQRLKGGE